jgi:hypothetical protein
VYLVQRKIIEQKPTYQKNSCLAILAHAHCDLATESQSS